MLSSLHGAHFAIGCVLAFGASAFGQTETPGPHLYERAVLLVTEEDPLHPERIESKFASAFIVESSGELYLVTATHRARATTAETSIGIPGLLASHWMRLAQAVTSRSDALWVHGRKTQLSVARLNDSLNDPFVAEARRIAISFDDLAEAPPDRGSQVEVIGYPITMPASRPARVAGFPELEGERFTRYTMLLNEQDAGAVTGVAVTAYIATRELRLDDEEVQSAIFLSPSIHPGFAGAPVFQVQRDDTRPACIGVFVARRFYRGGTGLPAIVAARCLRELIHDQQLEGTTLNVPSE